MQKTIRLSSLILILVSFGAFALEVSHHGYMRSGVGTSFKGGDQVCFNSFDPVGANEFRLGAECDTYGELAFDLNHDSLFRTYLMLSYSGDGHQTYESTPIKMVQSYVESIPSKSLPLKYWAGKRYLREEDLLIHDWYYFANMSANGGGVGNIKLGKKLGSLDISYLKEVQSTSNTSEIGIHGVHFLDVRWRDIKLHRHHTLKGWFAYGQTSGSKQYAKVNGIAVGVLHFWKLKKGFQQFSFIYGDGAMKDLNVYISPVIAKNSKEKKEVEGARRYRFVAQNYREDLGIKRLSMLSNFNWEYIHNGDQKANHPRSQWLSLAARPIYAFDDHYRLAFEAGHSIVEQSGHKPMRHLPALPWPRKWPWARVFGPDP